MNWLFFALLAPLIYAVVVDIDKYILEKQIPDYRGVPIYSAIMAAIFGSFLWIITGFPLLSFQDTFLVVFTGMLTLWGSAFYFKALSSHEASNITILFQTQPVITLILSFLFLKDAITGSQLLGFFLILLATTGISLSKEQVKFKLSSAFILILLANIFWAIASVVFKYVSESSSFSKMISFESWGIALGGLILYIFFPTYSEAFKRTQKKVRRVALALILFNEGGFLVGRFFTYLAISIGPVALVSVIGGTQVFFSILFGFFLTLIAPKIFKENISKVGLSKKIIMSSLILAGLWLVQS